MSLSAFKLTATDFTPYGHALQRPECVWIDRGGVWASDARGGVCRIHVDREPQMLSSARSA